MKHKANQEIEEDKKFLLGKTIFGNSYGVINGFADDCRDWLEAGLSLLDFALLERDFDLLELFEMPFDGNDADVVDVGTSNVLSFVAMCNESLFDCDSVELSLDKRLFE